MRSCKELLNFVRERVNKNKQVQVSERVQSISLFPHQSGQLKGFSGKLYDSRFQRWQAYK